MEQLLTFDRAGMHAVWDSVWGDGLFHRLRGADMGDRGAQRSLGHSHVFGPERSTPGEDGGRDRNCCTRQRCACAWSTSMQAR
jgi:hypothetical protein